MLHEILLSLSGHPSPLFRTAAAAESHAHQQQQQLDDAALSPPERELLASVAHLSDLHVRLRTAAAQIAASHPSTICRAVAASVDAAHLRSFQDKVLEVEGAVLRRDAAFVGAYDIVPLTAVVGEFAEWTRRMEWLWEIVQFLMTGHEKTRGPDGNGGSKTCTGAMVIDRLRAELQTGYVDVEETARSLVRVAETAWLKQLSAWILYGRLPSFGAEDFFVKWSDQGDEDHVSRADLLPSFVTSSTAASMLFIGRSLNRIRAKGNTDSGLHGVDHLSSQLKEIARLDSPLDQATFSRTIMGIRQYLSRTTLQKLLPLAKVLEMLQLLRDFFLLGRGEFAMALTQQADEKIRNRWRRADNLAYEKRDGLSNVVVKEGEISAVLGRTWAALGSMQGQHSEEDEGLERARDMLRLKLASSEVPMSAKASASRRGKHGSDMSSMPFRNLLFSVPVVLTMQVPSPIDLFLSSSDLETYTAINSYLMSIRRAHLRLTDLWKISSLRRHHPPPPGPPYGSTRSGQERMRLLRQRYNSRSDTMRRTWATSSAAIFFLAETEAYLQTEVVAALWEGFRRWLTTGRDDGKHEAPSWTPTRPSTPNKGITKVKDEDVWLADMITKVTVASTRRPAPPGQQDRPLHDPQTLATGHRLYLRALTRRLLLTQQPFTDALYDLLVHTDCLVALVHRLQGIWTSLDLEADVGVVDAFLDLEREERDVAREISAVESRVKTGVEGAVAELRRLEADYEAFEDMVGAGVEGNAADAAEGEAEDDVDGLGDGSSGDLFCREEGQYAPRRVGGVDRLLMKLDFGSWFDAGRRNTRLGRDEL